MVTFSEYLSIRIFIKLFSLEKEAAFCIKLSKTWAILFSSPKTWISSACFKRLIFEFIVDDLISTRVSRRFEILISLISILDNSASNLEAAEISFINLSILSTSFCITLINFFCSLKLLTFVIVSEADLTEVIGFFNSCATSAANSAIWSILFCNSLVILKKDCAKLPISSFLFLNLFRLKVFNVLSSAILSASLDNLTIGFVIDLPK